MAKFAINSRFFLVIPDDSLTGDYCGWFALFLFFNTLDDSPILWTIVFRSRNDRTSNYYWARTNVKLNLGKNCINWQNSLNLSLQANDVDEDNDCSADSCVRIKSVALPRIEAERMRFYAEEKPYWISHRPHRERQSGKETPHDEKSY